jgi:sporulation protein YlmC with PRC-barrel domain
MKEQVVTFDAGKRLLFCVVGYLRLEPARCLTRQTRPSRLKADIRSQGLDVVINLTQPELMDCISQLRCRFHCRLPAIDLAMLVPSRARGLQNVARHPFNPLIMKGKAMYARFFGVFSAATVLGVALVTTAQTPTTPRTAANTPTTGAHAWKASDVIGQSVYTMDDQEKGKIKDLMIEPDGKIAYAAVSFGGFLGIGDKLFAVPMDAIHITWKDGKVEKAKVDVTEQSIKQRQGFDNDHWPQQADRGFVASQPVPTTTK